MNYDRSHSSRSTLALILAVVALAVSVLFVAVMRYQSARLAELEEKWRAQHDNLVTLEERVERCDAILDRALDAASVARAVLEEAKEQ